MALCILSTYLGSAVGKKVRMRENLNQWSESCSVVSDSLQPPWNSPGQNTGVGSLFLLQGIFPTQGLNSGFPHCRQILYQLSHKGSLRILEGVAYPFSSRSSWLRDWTGIYCIVGRFFTSWAMREPPEKNLAKAMISGWRGNWCNCQTSLAQVPQDI